MKKLLAVLAIFISSNVNANCENGFVRLTFDDGPNPIHTLNILDILQKYNSKATFFVVGQNVVKYPEVVKRIVADGNRVGNHSWDHPHLTKLTYGEILAQFKNTNDEIKKITGFNAIEWRPPYEDWNSDVQDAAARQGMSIALWDYSTDSHDWKESSVEKIVETVVSNAKNSSIILLHDSYEHTVKALPSILEGLSNKGLCAR